jgi:hypothetical protein
VCCNSATLDGGLTLLQGAGVARERQRQQRQQRGQRQQSRDPHFLRFS